MYNGGKIIAGLIIFLALVTFPVYYNMGKKIPAPSPSLDTPVINQMKVKHCVESREFMRANHMKLLRGWMTTVLSGKGSTTYVSTSGQKYDMSWDTCWKCHSSKKQFCDKCHQYMAVDLPCWKCHSEPNT